MRTRMILLPIVLILTACVQPGTDCRNVAAWVELGALTRETPPADGSRDAEYEEMLAARREIKNRMKEHDQKFAVALEKQLANPTVTDYASLYALCRQWETGNY